MLILFPWPNSSHAEALTEQLKARLTDALFLMWNFSESESVTVSQKWFEFIFAFYVSKCGVKAMTLTAITREDNEEPQWDIMYN